ncbi:BCCT family transporter [Salisediminibacterium halotolerans]|uniref:Glycine betaine transporter n=1 Tax=Salisediminibacterium halotolerans TaxID=517425 RepID=A0A1H9RLK2_9BACI|nr:BCCT family transporter [Salisediminibacterium haloalkalitolerans]SER73425.1 glycine betaine transporter [Salisediminibacterium haloalkalitolerans]
MKDRISANIVFIISALIVFSVVLWGVLSPENMTGVMDLIMHTMIEQFGWFYVLATALFVGFCLFLGFGSYRHMKLGKKTEVPEYSYFTWLGMLFAAGMGVGLVFWGAGEPLSHFEEPFNGAAPGSEEAAADALLWSVFHWGIHPWSIYAIVALGLAFAKFRKNLPGMVSSAFYPLLGKHIYKWPGNMIDILVIVATTVGIATSFGMSTMQVGIGLSEVFGIANNEFLYLMIILVVTLIFIISAVSGLNKGMRFLSISNLGLAGILLIAALILGPTVFLLEHIPKTFGSYIAALPDLSLFTTPYSSNEWMGDWTLFYWAWIISWSPFVGTFIARVSRGRSLIEFIFGVLFVPAALTVVWFVAFGGTGIYFEMNGMQGIAAETAAKPEIGLFLVLQNLPGGLLLSIGALILIAIFFITSANSATYVLGVFSSGGDLDPRNLTLVVWGLLISSIATVLLLTGGLEGMQATATITAFPFTFLMLFMMLAIFRSLKIEGRETHQVDPKEDW